MRKHKRKFIKYINDNSSNDVFKSSILYKELLAERDEILKHKWIESEKIGKDIGINPILHDWIRNHRNEWIEMRKKNK